MGLEEDCHYNALTMKRIEDSLSFVIIHFTEGIAMQPDLMSTDCETHSSH